MQLKRDMAFFNSNRLLRSLTTKSVAQWMQINDYSPAQICRQLSYNYMAVFSPAEPFTCLTYPIVSCSVGILAFDLLTTMEDTYLTFDVICVMYLTFDLTGDVKMAVAVVGRLLWRSDKTVWDHCISLAVRLNLFLHWLKNNDKSYVL